MADICLYVCSVWLFLCLFFFGCLFVCSFVCFIRLLVCSVCLFACLSVCLFVDVCLCCLIVWLFVWFLLCVFVSPSIVCVDLLFLPSVTRLLFALFVLFLLIYHFEPPEIYNSSGKRAIGLNICFPRCFFQHFNEKPQFRIISLIYYHTSMNARGFGL